MKAVVLSVRAMLSSQDKTVLANQGPEVHCTLYSVHCTLSVVIDLSKDGGDKVGPSKLRKEGFGTFPFPIDITWHWPESEAGKQGKKEKKKKPNPYFGKLFFSVSM